MARIAVADGVKVMVATPHMMDAGPFANRAPEVLALAAEAQERLEMAGIDLEIVPGRAVFYRPDTGRDLFGRALDLRQSTALRAGGTSRRRRRLPMPNRRFLSASSQG